MFFTSCFAAFEATVHQRVRTLSQNIKDSKLLQAHLSKLGEARELPARSWRPSATSWRANRAAPLDIRSQSGRWGMAESTARTEGPVTCGFVLVRARRLELLTGFPTRS
jgi:hypothetical protein